jgi:hypothetical protein
MYKIYEEKIKNLFESYKSQDPELQEIINRKYVYSQFHTGRKVLFIGLNPSFRETQAKKEEYYKSFDATNNNDRYFRRFPLLVENKNDWTFLDLLYIRETRQRNIENFYKREPDFIKQQLEISKEIIKKINPEIIVVCDTFARDLFKSDTMNFEFEFDDTIGTYRIINNPDFKDTIVFFSGMLTGQRALDNGSFERLKWHLNKVKSLK